MRFSRQKICLKSCYDGVSYWISQDTDVIMDLCCFLQKRSNISGPFSPECPCRSAENKAELVIKQEKMFLNRDRVVICHTENHTGEIHPILFMISKTASKITNSILTYNLTCFCLCHHSSCLRNANDLWGVQSIVAPDLATISLYTVVYTFAMSGNVCRSDKRYDRTTGFQLVATSGYLDWCLAL